MAGMTAAEFRISACMRGIAPCPLYGEKEIARTFAVRTAAVREWFQAGAPILKNGTIYVSEFSALFVWLLLQKDQGKMTD